MELFQLESFRRVAETGSITRAADALFLTQPAVTQHIRALERELGVVLFERTGRGVRLTRAGETLLHYARESLALLDEGRRILRDLDAGNSGRLVLGAGVTTSIFRLPRWLRAYRERYPGVDIEVRTGRSREVAGMTLAREIDLGFVTSPVTSPDLEIVELYREEIVLVVPQSHPLTSTELTVERLAEEPLILFAPGTGFRNYLDRSLAEAGLTPRVKMESDSVEAIKSFVEVGLGASFLPRGAVDAEITAGTLAKVVVTGLPPLQRQTSAIYRRDRHLSTASQAFLRTVKQLLSSPSLQTGAE